jgi:hypothetical protein
MLAFEADPACIPSASVIRLIHSKAVITRNVFMPRGTLCKAAQAGTSLSVSAEPPQHAKYY